MKPHEWRQLGYKSIFTQGRIYLYRPERNLVAWCPILGGNWMACNDLNKMPWRIEPKGIDGLSPITQGRLKTAVELCQCAERKTCDFCANKIDPVAFKKKRDKLLKMKGD
ncbi:MAG: hypothetical protein ACXABD_14930 [Candidatus Thorarchaeota archaeon]|jgi:ribosomal protein S18